MKATCEIVISMCYIAAIVMASVAVIHGEGPMLAVVTVAIMAMLSGGGEA